MSSLYFSAIFFISGASSCIICGVAGRLAAEREHQPPDQRRQQDDGEAVVDQRQAFEHVEDRRQRFGDPGKPAVGDAGIQPVFLQQRRQLGSRKHQELLGAGLAGGNALGLADQPERHVRRLGAQACPSRPPRRPGWPGPACTSPRDRSSGVLRQQGHGEVLGIDSRVFHGVGLRVGEQGRGRRQILLGFRFLGFVVDRRTGNQAVPGLRRPPDDVSGPRRRTTGWGGSCSSTTSLRWAGRWVLPGDTTTAGRPSPGCGVPVPGPSGRT